MILFGSAEKGSRKLTAQREAMFVLLIGLLAAVYMKAPTELYTAFVAALVGIHSGFVYGNVKSNTLSFSPSTETSVTPTSTPTS